MKIVFTVATYWPYTDGVQMVTQYLAEGLAQKGHRIFVVTSIFNGIPEKETHNGVNIIRVNAYNFYYWHRGNKGEYVKTVKTLCEDAHALVAVCLQSFAADWLLNSLDDISCEKVLYLHGMPDFKMHLHERHGVKDVVKTAFRNIRWKLFYVVQWKKIKKFDVVTHLFKNDNSYKYFSTHGYPNNKVMENACEDVFFTEIPEKEKTEKYFICVGNYCDRKNQESALRAFYDTTNTDFGIIFIGSQENTYCKHLKEVNKRLKDRCGERNVRILYGVPREKISDYTKKAYACVMTSKYEYYPLTIVESLATGIPFISTKVGIVKYLPGGVIADTQEETTYWMDFMMRNPQYVHDLGQAGKKYVGSNLKVSAKVNDFEKILLEE